MLDRDPIADMPHRDDPHPDKNGAICSVTLREGIVLTVVWSAA